MLNKKKKRVAIFEVFECEMISDNYLIQPTNITKRTTHKKEFTVFFYSYSHYVEFKWCVNEVNSRLDEQCLKYWRSEKKIGLHQY